MAAKRSLRVKLLLNSVGTTLFGFFIVGALIFYAINMISGGFRQLNREQSASIQGDLKQIGQNNIERIRGIYGRVLEKQGRQLVEKDISTLAPMLEDNAFTQVREFLAKTFKDDPAILLTEFFVEEGDEVRAIQYLSRKFPTGLDFPIEFVPGKSAWRGTYKGRQVEVPAPDLADIRKLTSISLKLRDAQVPDASGEIKTTPVFDCVIPVFRRSTEAKKIVEAKRKKEQVGYLRYVLSLREMEAAIDAENKAFAKVLTEFQEGTERQAKAVESSVSATTAKVYGLMLMGLLVVLAVASIVGAWVAKRVTDPVKALTKIAQAMAAGDYKQKIDVKTDDEIGILADTFRDMASAILKRDEELATINKNLEKLVEERTGQLREQLQNIANLLNSMKQAVFAVDSGLKIIPPVSKFSDAVFGKKVEGENVLDTVYRGVESKSEKGVALRTALATVFGESELQWDLMVDNLPSDVEIPLQNGTVQSLRIAYNPLWNDKGELARILFVVDDITERLALERSIAAERAQTSQMVGVLQELGSNEIQDLEDFFEGSKGLCDRIEKNTENPGKDSWAEILRDLHTLKGNSRVYGLNGIGTVVHEVETAIHELNHANKSIADSRVQLESGLTSIVRELNRYSGFASRVLRVTNRFEGALLAELHRVMAQADRAWDTKKDLPKLLGQVQTIVSRLQRMELADEVKGLSSGSGDWYSFSKRIRELYRGTILCKPYPPKPEIWVPVFQAAVDLSRNAGSEAKAEELLTRAQARQFDLLSALAGELVEHVHAKKPDQAKAVMTEIVAYLRFALRADLIGKLRPKARGILMSELKEAVAGKRALSAVGAQGSVLVPVLRALERQKVPLADSVAFLGGLDSVIDVQTTENAINEWLSKLSGAQAEASEIAQSALTPGVKTLGPAYYLVATDLAQMLEALTPARLRKSSGIQLLEVVDFNYNKLKDFAEKQASPELISIVSTLLEVPVRTALWRFDGTVRDLSHRLGKSVNFRVSGEEATLNRDTLYVVMDSLVHLLRNSIDHGIELPEERKKAKKAEAGLIEIELASATAAGIELIVRDDGKGIDVDGLSKSAVAKGVLSSAEAGKLDKSGKLDLIFQSGLSTKTEVTDISGRGVGMDVVRENLTKLGATIKVSTELGSGTEFRISIPTSPRKSS